MTTIDEAVAAADFGTATARKAGRNPKFPYVPVVRYNKGGKYDDGYDQQILRLAYATRDEAIARAQKSIERSRETFARMLVKPEGRALREYLGLPREIIDWCTGDPYPVNPDAPSEGMDVHHDGPCPVHPDAEAD